MKAAVSFAAAIAAAWALPAIAGPGNAQSGQAKAAVCIGCHGPDGNSPELPAGTEQWPKLAGQMPEYIAKQILDFKAGRRKNEQMSPLATSVAEVDIADIAAFFATQPLKPAAAADKSQLALGEKIFMAGKGRPSAVAACVGCHGTKGEGQRAWNDSYKTAPTILAPAVGGQHASYVAKQLKGFRDGTRGNDVGKIMRQYAERLDDKEIAAVAAYIATLGR